MSKVVLISGSPALASRSNSILDYISLRLQEHSITTTMVGLRDFPAEDLVYAKYDSPVFDALKQALAEAHGVVVATPIYKASYTGGLKALLDILPQQALRRKTVLPIGSGGTYGHLLSLDYSLKPVLAVLGASDIQQGVFIVDNQFHYQESGGFTLDDEVQKRLDDGITQLAESVNAHIAR